jgi:hypothetical protein
LPWCAAKPTNRAYMRKMLKIKYHLTIHTIPYRSLLAIGLTDLRVVNRRSRSVAYTTGAIERKKLPSAVYRAATDQ